MHALVAHKECAVDKEQAVPFRSQPAVNLCSAAGSLILRRHAEHLPKQIWA